MKRKRKAPSQIRLDDNDDAEAGAGVIPKAGGIEQLGTSVSFDTTCWITEVPDVILYNILSFVEGPGERAPFLASTLSLVSQSAYALVEDEKSAVWEYILREYTPSDPVSGRKVARTSSTRHSTRLMKRTAKENVIAAHKVLRIRTEDAISQTAETAHDSEQPLSVARLRSIISAFGPIRINQRAKMGGTMLVECCRSRYVSEAVIRKCVAELIEQHGADPNIPAAEGHAGYEGAPLPALVIAAARGMPTVVKLLLEKGANPNDTGTSRFRLKKKPKKSFKGDKLTPLQFALEIKKAEEEWGASKDQVKDLDKVIKMLNDRHN